MKRAEERQLLVVDATRVERDHRAGRAAAEEDHAAAATRGRHRAFPRLRPSGGVERDVAATPAGRSTHRVDGVRGCRVDAFAEGELFHALEPPALLADDDHPGLPRRRDHCQQASEGAMTEDHDGLAGFDARALHGAERARQRLGERRARRRRRGGQLHEVALDQPCGQPDELAVRAVDEQQIFAEVRAVGATRGTRAARRGVRRHDAISGLDTVHAATHRRDRPGELVAEHGGDDGDHHGMAAPKNLHVRPARERGLDLQHHLADVGRRHGKLFGAQVARTVEDHRAHRPGHVVTKTFRASRRRTSSSPSASRSSGT